MRSLHLILICLAIIAGCSKDKPSADVPQELDYEIINIYPHNTSYFTQGFEFVGDTLVESTGHYGNSKLVKYRINDAQILDQINLASAYFGEGITVLNGSIFQLTWWEQTCFVYNYSDLAKISEFSYTGEGWGICNDGTDLITSNGSSTLYFRNPSDFSVIRTISVKDSNNVSVTDLNELEYASGLIYANVWGKNHIISIDPETGIVLHRYYLTDLLTSEESYQADVLNGIAFKNGNFFVTGKYWPKIFEIKLLDN
jgi:glutaminyl-peptide cyclotransferase